MIARVSGFGIKLGRFSRPWRQVGVITMPHAGQGKMRRVEVPPRAGVIRLRVSLVTVAVFIDCPCVEDRVQVTH
jgi:hypothetical protein